MVGNSDHMNITSGKGGSETLARSSAPRPRGRHESRSTTRWVVAKVGPRAAGIPCSPTGKLAKGGKTRRRRKPSNSAIIRRRKSVRYGQLKL